MQISIKTLKGKSINLEVDDSSNSIDLKIHWEPMRELVLRLGPVPDPSPSEAIRIFVETLGGTTSTFKVKRSVTIEKIKAKIEEKDGTPVKDQGLLFEGQLLRDSLTIADYDIEDESTLLLMISLTTVKGKNINLEVEDSSDIIDLKIHGPTRQLVLGLGPDPGPGAVMRIFVSTVKEKTFILEVKGSDTIKNVKTMIHDQGGRPVDQLNLSFHGTKLENRRTIADYNIRPRANLVIIQSGCIC